MRDLQEVRQCIEVLRLELDSELEDGNVRAHYATSLALDALIEEYLDITEASTILH